MQTGRTDNQSIRVAGAALVAAVVGSLVVVTAAGPPSSKMFNASDPQERMEAIADNKRGWNVLAVLIGVTSAAVTVVFGVVAWRLRGPARVLAIAATLLDMLSTLLWLPLMLGRLRASAQVDEMIQSYHPGDEPDLSDGAGWAFWPYTHTGLASIGGLGLALAWSGLRRKTGAVACGLTLLSETVLIPWWRDWMPALTYFFASLIGVGLVIEREARGQRWPRQ